MWIPEYPGALDHRWISWTERREPIPDHMASALFQRPWLQTDCKTSRACQQIVSVISLETAMYHLSPSNRSTWWPDLPDWKYIPFDLHKMYSVMLGTKGRSPAPGECLRHKLENFNRIVTTMMIWLIPVCTSVHWLAIAQLIANTFYIGFMKFEGRALAGLARITEIYSSWYKSKF